jgi:hypothetical protein
MQPITLSPMRNILATTGLILIASIVTGCAAPKNIDEAVAAYEKLEGQVTAYEPVGDAKIDGLARPFVTSAIQLKADVDKEHKAIEANPISKEFGKLSPSEVPAAYAALSAERRKAIDDAAAAAAKADSSRLDNLLKQVVDLGVAGGKLVVEINDAAKGGAGGTAGIGESVFKAASGPGGKAAAQVNRSVEFCPAAEAMINHYRATVSEIAAAIQSNIRKAQS